MFVFFASIGRTLRSIYDKGLWRYIALSALLNVAIWTIIVSLVGWGLYNTDLLSIGWLDKVVDIIGVGLVSVVALLLFPFTFPLAISLFYDGVIKQVEKKYSESNFAVVEIPLRRLVFMEGRFLLITVLLNILLLPLYFIPVLNIMMFFFYYVVNGYLLGREFFMMVAIRYLNIKEAKALRKKNRWKVTAAGVSILLLSLLPVVNLFVPILICVFMVHLYHKL